MAKLSSTLLARTAARSGVARAGATRSGFVPGYTTGTTPGSSGGLYGWREPTAITTAWTNVKDENG